MVQIFDELESLEGLCRTQQHVEQIGFIDLRVAYSTGVVALDIEGVDGNFNGIEDPATILGKPDDVFSAMRAADAVSVSSSSESHPESGEQGA
jgi:hypothetical protein